MDLRDTPFAGRYRCLYVDPPWHFKTKSVRGQNGKHASHHYPTMTLDQMLAARWPVAEIAAPACWLLIWSTWPHLTEAMRLVESWSDPTNPWTYRTGGVWAKRPRGWRGGPDHWQFGTGYLFRSASEPLLVYGRGHVPWDGRAERNLWVEPIREHSRKPKAVRAMIERAVPGPRLEMFARERAPGWDSWGLETRAFDG